MAGLSDYLIKKLLDEWCGAQSFSAPSTLYFALFTVLPNDAGSGGTEVSGGSYARKDMTNNNTNFPDSTLSTGLKTNGTAITFATASAGWGSVIGVGIYDASSGGNLLATAAITAQTIASGDTFSIPVGSLRINLT